MGIDTACAFQSPIGTQKTVILSAGGGGMISVSIPYRYTKNGRSAIRATASRTGFNPL